MKKIICRINNRTGAMTIRAEGFSGEECLKATAPLEKGLGLRDATQELTPEFYQTAEQQSEQQQGTQ